MVPTFPDWEMPSHFSSFSSPSGNHVILNKRLTNCTKQNISQGFNILHQGFYFQFSVL